MKYLASFILAVCFTTQLFARPSRCDLARIETLRNDIVAAYHAGDRARFRKTFEAFHSQCGALSYDPHFLTQKHLLQEFYWTVASWMELAGKIGDIGACIERGTEWIYQFPHSNIEAIEKQTPSIRDVLVHHLEECQKERFSTYVRLANRPCPSGEAASIEIPDELKKMFPTAPWASSQCIRFHSPEDSATERATTSPGLYVTDSTGTVKDGGLKVRGEEFSCGSVSLRFYRGAKEDKYFLHAKGTAVPCRRGSAVETVDSFYEWNATGLKELQTFGVGVH